MVVINLNVSSKKWEIKEFLIELKDLLLSGKYLLVFIPRSENMRTMIDLNYDNSDIIDRLLELTIEEYSETLIDKNNTDPLLLYVFGKEIQKKLVYIKLKIRKHEENEIICVSFHYANREMNFPFR